MFGFIKKIFLGFLASIFSVSSQTKCVFLRNQKWTIQPTIIYSYHIEYTQDLHYYPFAVNLDRCVRSCNTLNDLCNKVRVLNKTEDLNLGVFNMITGIKE